MEIFVINSGSSSIKYQLFSQDSSSPLCSGLVERIGQPDALITHKYRQHDEEKVLYIQQQVPDHEAGMQVVGELLTRDGIAVIRDSGQVGAVGHRVVHGGEKLTGTTVITPGVKDKIKALYPLAPLHNPGHIKGIEVSEKIFPRLYRLLYLIPRFIHRYPKKLLGMLYPTLFIKTTAFVFMAFMA